MIETNATLAIKGTQTADGDTEVTELNVVGRLEKTDRGYIIEYTDYASVDDNRTVISFNEDTLIMTKLGEINTEMLFKEGMRTNCDYQTPYGNFEIGIYTNKLSIRADKKGAKIKLEYNIDFNYGFAAVNKLDIKAEYTQTDKETNNVLIS